ncbi:hypothetical protein OC842_004791 [Tilletia horrida]|uniref:Isochorismatase-like domain-containing protein n=1 Tax=Tilletia horrida TaxID=155126 RepID=A0AAN6GBD4_9BASI|nr:hypothetical protein OC842_004791 [Tilletia horrida]
MVIGDEGSAPGLVNVPLLSASLIRTAIHGFDHVVNSTSKVLRAAQILELPVFTTEQNPRALGATVSPLLDIIKTFPPVSSEAVHAKTRFSMLLPDVTDKWLDSAVDGGVKHVVMTGIESHVCVLQTTLDLLERGVQVHVLADAVSSCNAEEVPLALARLRQAGAQISTSESVLFQLLEDASHPSFKAISSLIKEEKSRTAEALQGLAAKPAS